MLITKNLHVLHCLRILPPLKYWGAYHWFRAKMQGAIKCSKKYLVLGLSMGIELMPFWAPFHKGLWLIASFLYTWFAIEQWLISIIRLIATFYETGALVSADHILTSSSVPEKTHFNNWSLPIQMGLGAGGRCPWRRRPWPRTRPAWRGVGAWTAWGAVLPSGPQGGGRSWTDPVDEQRNILVSLEYIQE